MKLLPFLSRLWTDIILDLITGLFISNNYIVILIVVHYLTKKRYYISYITNENSITTKTIALLLFQNIWKLHGLLLLFTSDKGSHFISKV